MSVRPVPASPSPVEAVPMTQPLPAFRGEGFPMLPIAILVTLAVLAIFAEFIAPHNPEIGSLSQRFKWVPRRPFSNVAYLVRKGDLTSTGRRGVSFSREKLRLWPNTVLPSERRGRLFAETGIHREWYAPVSNLGADAARSFPLPSTRPMAALAVRLSGAVLMCNEGTDGWACRRCKARRQ